MPPPLRTAEAVTMTPELVDELAERLAHHLRTTDPDQLLTRKMVYALTPFGRTKVDLWISQRRIPMDKVDGCWMISREAYRRASISGFALPAGPVRRQVDLKYRELVNAVRRACREGSLAALRELGL